MLKLYVKKRPYATTLFSGCTDVCKGVLSLVLVARTFPHCQDFRPGVYLAISNEYGDCSLGGHAYLLLGGDRSETVDEVVMSLRMLFITPEL